MLRGPACLSRNSSANGLAKAIAWSSTAQCTPQQSTCLVVSEGDKVAAVYCIAGQTNIPLSCNCLEAVSGTRGVNVEH